VSSDELKRQIRKMKKEKPNLEVWVKDENDSLVNMDSENDRFIYCSFRISPIRDSTIIMYCILYQNSDPAIILLDRTSPMDYRTFKHINTNDFTSEENERMKYIFEKQVLSQLKIKWKRK
jgi:hypothetical protein